MKPTDHCLNVLKPASLERITGGAPVTLSTTDEQLKAWCNAGRREVPSNPDMGCLRKVWANAITTTIGVVNQSFAGDK